MSDWSIRCSYHTYVTLYYKDKQVICLDNDMTYGEDIVDYIEKRTKTPIRNIPINGSKSDFKGIRFRVGGWSVDFFEKAEQISKIRKVFTTF